MISYQEWLDQLAEVALGWLGWTEEQLFYSDLNSIALGLAGKKDMLRYVFGTGEDDKSIVRGRDGKPVPLSARLFDSLKVNKATKH